MRRLWMLDSWGICVYQIFEARCSFYAFFCQRGGGSVVLTALRPPWLLLETGTGPLLLKFD